MQNKLKLYAFVKTKSAAKTFKTVMETQLSELDILYQILRADGWEGKAATETDEIYAWMKPAHQNAVLLLEEWQDCVETLRANGVSAVDSAVNKIMGSFDGGTGYAGTTIGYNDSHVELVEGNVSDLNHSVVDMFTELANISSDAYSLGEEYGATSEITALQNAVGEYANMYADFRSRYYEAVQTYNDFLNDVQTSLSGQQTGFSSLRKTLAADRPGQKIKDMSSPIYRAHEMARVLSQLPAADRAAIEEYIYGADPAYRDSFIAYVDKFNVAGLHGVPVFGGEVALGPWIYIDIDKHPQTIVVGQNPDGTPIEIPQWYAAFFHEVAHQIDYATNHDAGALNQAIRDDVRTYLIDLGNKIESNPDPNALALAVGYLLMGERIEKQPAPDAPEMVRLMYSLREEVRDGFSPSTSQQQYEIADISDVYGIATNNCLKGSWGHPDPYCLIPNAAQLELFAHNYSAGILGYEVKENYIDDYLPGASAMLDGIMEDIAGQGEERMK